MEIMHKLAGYIFVGGLILGGLFTVLALVDIIIVKRENALLLCQISSTKTVEIKNYTQAEMVSEGEITIKAEAYCNGEKYILADSNSSGTWIRTRIPRDIWVKLKPGDEIECPILNVNGGILMDREIYPEGPCKRKENSPALI